MIHLSRSTAADIDFVVCAEEAIDTSRFIFPWDRERHRLAIEDPDCAHFIRYYAKGKKRLVR
jgi:hypothetical protein